MWPMVSSNTEIRLGAAQISEVYLDRASTIEKDCEYIQLAGEQDIDLLVFPEFHIPASPYWYWYDDDYDSFQTYYRAMFEESVAVPGPATDRLCTAAREADVAVIMGINEREPDSLGTMYNSQVFIDSDGTLLGSRRKLVPTRHERIFHTGGTGESITTFESSLGTFGGLMCGEHTNPLAIFSILALGETVHGAAWPAMPQADRPPEFRERTIGLRTRYHAFAGKVPTVSASGVVTDELAAAVGGMPETYADSGSSAIIAPDGSYLAGPKWEGEGIVATTVDRGASIEGRAYHDILGHYNRFDIFDLRVDRRPRPRITTRDGPGSEARTASNEGPANDGDLAAAMATIQRAASELDDRTLERIHSELETHLAGDTSFQIEDG